MLLYQLKDTHALRKEKKMPPYLTKRLAACIKTTNSFGAWCRHIREVQLFCGGSTRAVLNHRLNTNTFFASAPRANKQKC